MKKSLRYIISGIAFLVIIFVFQNSVQAKSYYIENMDINATVEKNGDVQIEQTMEYSFNGNYNGIYITIPTKFENKEDVISKISDDIYNAQWVELKNVSLIQNGEEIKYSAAINNFATNGTSGVYTQELDSDIYKLKVYCKSSNQNRIFKVQYVLKNLCVSHNDVAELYYNFIGGEWECAIKNLNINVFLPTNNTEPKIWGHGPDNGTSKIVNNTFVKFKVSNIAAGKYVAARVVFDKEVISNSTKLSNINASEIIFGDEAKIAKISDAKKLYTRNIYIFALVLMAYWIFLLIKYERDKKYPVAVINEEELFEKYNPMLAGCLQGSRDILARDIIAVILNLIDKKIIKMEIMQNLQSGSTLDFITSKMKGIDNKYKYFIEKVPDKESEMDEVESFVYKWLFGTKNKTELTDALEQMPKDKLANDKFKELNSIVQSRLNEQKANEKAVPLLLRIVNTIVFIISVFVTFHHIMYEGIEIYNSTDIAILIISFMIRFVPILILVLYIPMLILVKIRHKVLSLIHKITGQKVVTTSIAIIVIFFVAFILTLIYANPGNRYIIADEVLICIALIIMLTDNLMMKNNATMIEDYSKINALKDKIENYSMMDDRDIEQIVLWEKYLAYAISFGCASKIANRIKQMHLDDDILGILNNYKIMDFIMSDYYLFYDIASLDRRFLNGYRKVIGAMGDGIGSSSGRWRRFLWWWWLLWRRWPRRPEEEHFRLKEYAK